MSSTLIHKSTSFKIFLAKTIRVPSPFRSNSKFHTAHIIVAAMASGHKQLYCPFCGHAASLYYGEFRRPHFIKAELWPPALFRHESFGWRFP